MRNSNQLWEAIGDVDEEETGHVLTRLFTMYEQLLANDSKNQEALNFFRNLDTALTQTTECNLNRR
jgi:predicted ATPase